MLRCTLSDGEAASSLVTDTDNQLSMSVIRAFAPYKEDCKFQ